jgi:ATP-dependent protease ClpP protease subunit
MTKRVIAKGAWWTIKAAADAADSTTAEILIYGDIGETWWGESVTAKDFVEQINALTADEITIRINSYGGSVTDGLAIYNAIKRKTATTNVEIDGVAYSIASLIAMAGDTVRIAENALLMIHAPWGMAAGNSQDMRDYADMLDTYAAAMANSYMAKSGKSRDDIMQLLTDGLDHFYTADEAKAEGFVDEIVNAMPVAAALASKFDLTRYSRPAGRSIPPKQEPSMAKTDPNAAGGNATDPAPNHQPNEAEIRAQALAAEQQRRTDIRAVFSRFKDSDGGLALMERYLDDPDKTVEQARAALLDHLGQGTDPANPANYSPRIEPGVSAQDKFRAATVNAILARCGKEKRDPQNEWTGRKLIEMARASLDLAGVNVRGKLPLEIASMALSRGVWAASQSTSDFSVILENTLHKELIGAWNTTPDTWSRVCKIGSVGDLRAWNRINPGTIGDIDTVTESGEYKFKAIPDGIKESNQAVRRGNRIAVTPEVIINDDLSYFSDVPAMFGRAARRTIETAFYTLLTSNSGVGPTMKEDSLALFHTTHGNYVTSGAAPSVTTIDAGRQAMAGQRDVSGNEYLDITPVIWLGPLSLGSTARVVNNSTYDPDASNKLQRANPVANLFRDIIDTARLSGTGWYMFADPAIHPVFEVVFLDGQTEPMLTQQEDFATAGLVWRVELPFGVGCIGWRGAYYNDGAP